MPKEASKMVRSIRFGGILKGGHFDGASSDSDDGLAGLADCGRANVVGVGDAIPAECRRPNRLGTAFNSHGAGEEKEFQYATR